MKSFISILVFAMIPYITVGVESRWYKVATDNFGNKGKQWHLLKADGDYIYPEESIPKGVCKQNDPVRTVAYSSNSVDIRYRGLDPKADYNLRLMFLSDSNDRIQSIIIDGIEVKPKFSLAKNQITPIEVIVPKEAIADGQVSLFIKRIKGTNAIISLAELWSTNPKLKTDIMADVKCGMGVRISGTIRNRNSGSILSGISVKAQMGNRKDSLMTKSDSRGHFSLKIPQSWLRVENATFTVVISGKGDRSEVNMSVVDMIATMPLHLSPKPLRVAKLKILSKSLNGMWKFIKKAPINIQNPTNADDWNDIQVPGEWYMQGFKVTPNTFAGFYRTFDVPAEWRGKRVKIGFDAVYSECVVFVNGKNVGGHIGGFTPFELDITDVVSFGEEAVITLKVKNESIADKMATGSIYACHPLGGINRKVTLFTLPTINISDIAVRTTFDKSFTDSTLTILATVTNESNTMAKSGKLKFELREWTKGSSATRQNITLNRSVGDLPALEPGESTELTITTQVKNPKKWDCENPNLYVLTTKLVVAGNEMEVVEKRFGFCQVDIKGNEMFVNGKPIKLRGINRHEAHPLRGRSLTPGLWRKDAELFRNANVNLIRTCHYPPAEELIIACDEIGLFVEVEAPHCWSPASGKQFKEPTVRQAMEMVMLNRSHPSVLMWSLANESGRWGENFIKSSKAVRTLDPTRPQTFNWAYPKLHTAEEPYCEVANIHYPGDSGPTQSKKYGKRPVYFGEYCHLNAYNRFELATDQSLRDLWGAYLDKIWKKMHKTKGCLGGSIWSGIDDVFFAYGLTLGYGTWGPIDGWRRPKPEWWGMKKAYSPIRIDRSTIRIQKTKVVVPVENWQNFSNLNRLTINWTLDDKSGTVSADIAPGSKGELVIPVNDEVGGILELIFNDPRGFMVDHFKLQVGKIASFKTEPIKKTAVNTSYVVMQTSKTIAVKGKNATYIIDSTTGLFTSVTNNGKSLTVAGPHLMILPLNGGGVIRMEPKDNPLKYGAFTEPCKNWKMSSVTKTVKNGLPVLTIAGSYKEASGKFTYIFASDGAITIHYDFKTKNKVNPRQLGIVFDLHKSCSTLRWKRKGYWTTYPDWHIARLSGMAKAEEGVYVTCVGPKVEPKHQWRHDRTAIGSHDFCSTKHNIYSASLTDNTGNGLTVSANANRHIRVWNEAESIRMLIAHYSNGGSERFLRRFTNKDDRILNKDDIISSKSTIYILK